MEKPTEEAMKEAYAERGEILVLSGPAGSGKGSAVRELLRLYPDKYALSVSCTTRSPRQGETDGIHYFFLTGEEFEKKIEEGGFLEYARYCTGQCYGTPRDFVEKQLSAGKNVILEIDVQGGMQIKDNHPQAALVMIVPPDEATLEKRLRGRGTESEEEILKRLEASKAELMQLENYDYLVFNYDGELTRAAQEIHAIMETQKRKIGRYPDFYKRFYKEKEQ